MNPFTVLKQYDLQAFNRLRRDYQKRLRSFPATLQPIPQEELAEVIKDKQNLNPPRQSWRSRDYLVQLFKQGEHYRLSINRCAIDAQGQWLGDITWDQLMECKRQCGYGEHWATEVYPADSHLVNVANIRHLFLTVHPPAYAWLKP